MSAALLISLSARLAIICGKGNTQIVSEKRMPLNDYRIRNLHQAEYLQIFLNLCGEVSAVHCCLTDSKLNTHANYSNGAESLSLVRLDNMIIITSISDN